MLPAATKLRWLQNPQAGPAPGYYYPALIAHPVVVCNPRGIYFDHISHHILMFVLALSRGLPDYLEAQRQRRWDQHARQHPYIYLGKATALIVGVGGIGHETTRLCTALGMTVLGVDPRPEYAVTGVEIHPVADLDTLATHLWEPTGVWTLALAAQVCHEQGVTERGMRDATLRRALQRLRTHWQRAKHGITSPDPQYARKKSGVIA